MKVATLFLQTVLHVFVTRVAAGFAPFNRLAVHDALDSDPRHRHLLASWGNPLSEASMYPLVGALARPTRHNQVSFGNLVLNCGVEVGEGGAGRDDELLVPQLHKKLPPMAAKKACTWR